MTGAVTGFALVFVVTALTASALATLVLTAARRSLARRGPLAERRAAAIAAIAPVAAATAAVSALVLQATLGADHCETHDHHAHLCFAHGAQWLERPWVLVMVAVAAATFVGRAVILGAAYRRGARSIEDLYPLSRPCGDVRIVESTRAFCFVTRRGVFVSSHVWSSLPEDERAALVAHERAHATQGDLKMRALLEGLLLCAAPIAADRVRDMWLRASERLCDAHAAAATAPESVARALVSMCRLGSAQPAMTFAFTPTARDLAERIDAVLAGGPLGERAARVVSRTAFVSGVASALAVLAAAEPLHHAFETLLG